MAQIAAAPGGIDVLVNTAGTASIAPAERMTYAEWRRTFNTNLFGPMACIRAVLPPMRQRRKGTIINISSINGRVPVEGGAAYVASKFALEGLSETLRLELGPLGIRVVIVEPGQFATDIWEKTKTLFDQDSEPSYAAISEDWRSLGGEPPPGAADPHNVGVLVADIMENPDPAQRYPIGPVADMTAAEWIARHVANSIGLKD